MPDPIVTPAATPAAAPSPAPAVSPGAASPAPAAVPSTAAAAPVTLATLDPGAPPLSAVPPAPAAFPDDWRQKLAGDDKSALTDLAKYTDPGAVYKSLRSLQAEISSGKLKPPAQPLPANATDEQKAAWRTAQGIPDKPEAYVEKIALPDGVVLGEADKPLITDFAKTAMEKGWSQSQFNDAVGWWHQAQETAVAQRAESDSIGRTQAQTQLMTEWGPGDYRVNMNAVVSFLETVPADLRMLMLAARTPDGRMIGDTVEFNKWAAGHARELNPAAALVAASETNAPKAIADEIAQINSVLAKAYSGDREAHWQYYGKDGKPGLQARERELITAQQAMEARARGRAA